MSGVSQPVRCPRTAAARVHDLHPFDHRLKRAIPCKLSAVRTRTLTHWAYREAGLEIPRLAQEQDIGGAIDPGSLRPGDLAVWDGHVGMIVGNGTMIEPGWLKGYAPSNTASGQTLSPGP